MNKNSAKMIALAALASSFAATQAAAGAATTGISHVNSRLSSAVLNQRSSELTTSRRPIESSQSSDVDDDYFWGGSHTHHHVEPENKAVGREGAFDA